MVHFNFNTRNLISTKQIDRLPNIFDNAGQVVLGIAVFSPVVSGFDKINPFIVASGIVCVFTCWIASFWLAGKGRKR